MKLFRLEQRFNEQVTMARLFPGQSNRVFYTAELSQGNTKFFKVYNNEQAKLGVDNKAVIVTDPSSVLHSVTLTTIPSSVLQ